MRDVAAVVVGCDRGGSWTLRDTWTCWVTIDRFEGLLRFKSIWASIRITPYDVISLLILHSFVLWFIVILMKWNILQFDKRVTTVDSVWNHLLCYAMEKESYNSLKLTKVVTARFTVLLFQFIHTPMISWRHKWFTRKREMSTCFPDLNPRNCHHAWSQCRPELSCQATDCLQNPFSLKRQNCHCLFLSRLIWTKFVFIFWFKIWILKF